MRDEIFTATASRKALCMWHKVGRIVIIIIEILLLARSTTPTISGTVEHLPPPAIGPSLVQISTPPSAEKGTRHKAQALCKSGTWRPAWKQGQSQSIQVQSSRHPINAGSHSQVEPVNLFPCPLFSATGRALILPLSGVPDLIPVSGTAAVVLSSGMNLSVSSQVIARTAMAPKSRKRSGRRKSLEPAHVHVLTAAEHTPTRKRFPHGNFLTSQGALPLHSYNKLDDPPAPSFLLQPQSFWLNTLFGDDDDGRSRILFRTIDL
jgi:hypothetical protein